MAVTNRIDCNTGGGGGGEVFARGLARVFLCCCTQGPWCPGCGVKDSLLLALKQQR
ncbi:hypothetical protein M9458_050444, partial [Cirrhinus mrigala]